MRVLSCAATFSINREGDDGRLHCNLVVTLATCGYKCPQRGYDYRMNPTPGKQLLERDILDLLLCLDVESKMREDLILNHWEQHHCPTGSAARLKAH